MLDRKEILKLIENRIKILKKCIIKLPDEDSGFIKDAWDLNLRTRKAEAELIKEMIEKNKIEGHF